MGSVAPGAPQVVATEVEPVGSKQLVGPGVVERRPLEIEEQKLGLDLRGALLNALEQRTAWRIGGVCREPQARVGGGSPQYVLDLGELERRALKVPAID